MPFWNPFQRLGYPGYCDLQSGMWYPVLWFIQLFGTYDITSLIVESVSCFLIAGWGMFKLSKSLHRCERTASILAVSYALSGFMVGSAQLMVFLIGVAWTPWIFWSLLQWLREASMRHALWLAVFIMCNITGASPAFTIVWMYIIPVAVLVHWFMHRNTKGYTRQILLSGLASLALLMALLLPFVISFIDFFPYFNRTGKLAYADMIINPFVWSDYISFLFPYSVLSDHAMFQVTDLSLRNGYIGLVGILFFLLFFAEGALTKRSTLWWLAGCCLAMWLALGDYSGIYQWVYHLPGFGLFRHPAFFRGFGMLCMLVLAGYTLALQLSTDKASRKLSYLFASFAFVSATVAVIAFTQTTPEAIAKSIDEILSRFEFPASGFRSMLFINACLVASLCALAWIAGYVLPGRIYTLLMGLTLVDFFIQTQLTAPTTLHHVIPYSSARDYFESLELMPPHDQRFNSMPLNTPDEIKNLLQTEGLDRNLATFNHVVSSDGENPMRFRAFDAAKKNGTFDWVACNSLFYSPRFIADGADSAAAGAIFAADVDAVELDDSLHVTNPRMDFNAYCAQVDNTSQSERWLIVNANFHHLWSAYLNGVRLPVYKVNQLVMGVRVPAKTQGDVLFAYESPYLLFAWLLAIIVLIASVAMLLFCRGRRNVAST